MRPCIGKTAVKTAAYICMIADHLAYAFFDNSPVAMLCHMAGKVTAPVMFFFVAEGFKYSDNVDAYMARLFVAAVISQWPFYTFYGGSVFFGNVIFTIFLALLALRIAKSGMDTAIRISVIIAICLFSTLCDWGPFGICCTLCFGFFDRKKGIKAFLLITMLKVIILAATGDAKVYEYIPGSLVAASLIWLLDDKKTEKIRAGRLGYAIYPLQFIAINTIKIWGGM